ncbi:MAG: PadR family transcriptional regulator [Homoserinimonas sp.]
MTPVFAHGHLRLYLLSLIGERPMHGYELIQELGDRFGGTYIPSAGTIYPRLAKLQGEGLIANEADGRKTVYTITDAGRTELLARAPELDLIETGVTDTVRHLADQVRLDVNGAMKSLRADLAVAARDAQQAARGEKRAARRTAGVQGRQELQEAELVVNEFRQLLKSELRALVARDELPPGTATRLKEQLDAVRAGVGGR